MRLFLSIHTNHRKNEILEIPKLLTFFKSLKILHYGLLTKLT